jgi:hypothetical protein
MEFNSYSKKLLEIFSKNIVYNESMAKTVYKIKNGKIIINQSDSFSKEDSQGKINSSSVFHNHYFLAVLLNLLKNIKVFIFYSISFI